MQVDKTRVVNDPTVKWISDHWSRDLTDTPAVPAFAFLRIPFDYAVSHRPGTRFGPQSIIDALNGYSLYCVDKRVSLENTAFCDFGSVDIVHDLEDSYSKMQSMVSEIPKQFVPIFLGGDHSISDPLIRGMQNRLGDRKFGIIVFDAHFDSREPIPGKEHSGHWMKTLEDTLDYRHVVQIGIDACIYSSHYMELAEDQGVLVRTPYEVRKRGWTQTIQDAIRHATGGTENVYLSVDIDALSQAFAPGTSVPNPVGLYPHELIDAVFEIASLAPVVGLDITEVSPILDHNNATSQVAAQIVLNFIAGIVKRSQNKGLDFGSHQ